MTFQAIDVSSNLETICKFPQRHSSRTITQINVPMLASCYLISMDENWQCVKQVSKDIVSGTIVTTFNIHHDPHTPVVLPPLPTTRDLYIPATRDLFASQHTTFDLSSLAACYLALSALSISPAHSS